MYAYVEIHIYLSINTKDFFGRNKLNENSFKIFYSARGEVVEITIRPKSRRILDSGFSENFLSCIFGFCGILRERIRILDLFWIPGIAYTDSNFFST